MSTPQELEPVSAGTVFFAFLRRDIRVAIRELPFFLIRTTMQPVLLRLIGVCPLCRRYVDAQAPPRGPSRM